MVILGPAPLFTHYSLVNTLSRKAIRDYSENR
jgi:hypothetical protein